MNNQKFDLKEGNMPAEFVAINLSEQSNIDGGNRKDQHQKEWYRRMAGFVIGTLIGGPSLGIIIATT